MNENTKLEMTKERLQLYYQAEAKVLTGQEYSIGSRSLKRADLGEIRQMITQLENEVIALSSKNNGRRAATRVILRDL